MTSAVAASPSAYQAFLRAKVQRAREFGSEVPAGAVHPILKPHQRDIVRWAVRGGRRAIFAAFGLGKSVMQLETMRLTLEHAAGVGLITCPLGVRQEFRRDAAMLGTPITFIRTTAEITGPGLYLTNYESVREGKIDVAGLTAVSLDEASILRGFGGTKTFRQFMKLFDATPYRYVATATPSPNQYIEILSYAAFLGIMEVGEGKTRYFQRDAERADNLTLLPHREAEFWAWVHTWAVFLQRPSELGYSDEGYELPPLTVHWHTVAADHREAGTDYLGQGKLLRDSSLGVTDAAAVKRDTIDARVAKVLEIVRASAQVGPNNGLPMPPQCVIWCDLNAEQQAIERALIDAGISVASLTGTQELEEREALIEEWRAGKRTVFLSKPVMYGAGINLQASHIGIFAGIGFKFYDLIQAVHRQHRYLQQHPVEIHLIYADAEIEVRRSLEAKWARHDELMARMSELIKEHGLSTLGLQERLQRTIGVERQEVSGTGWVAVNADSVEETARMDEASVGLIVTSIPFGTQYEYTPSYNDFGNTEDDDHFWAQMDFLSPELLRVLMPGRIMAVHVKDRIRPGGLEGLGFQTVSPFHADAILHYRRHGFAYMGMITITTDVVRENNQTYRLGWSEQCKDGSRMGVGMPEYLLIFRKPPTDRSSGYADVRVVKSKAEYTRARWQIDAHGFWRSNGNRLLDPAELTTLPADQVYKLWRGYSVTHVHDHELHVAVGETLEDAKRLPPGFALIPPASWHPEVWSDVTRMRTLNGVQQAKGREMHLCPIQYDIVDRSITRWSNEGDEVYDPFGGLGTVALRAVALGRRGRVVELNRGYWTDAVWHLRAADEKRAAPSLFDLCVVEEGAA